MSILAIDRQPLTALVFALLAGRSAGPRAAAKEVGVELRRYRIDRLAASARMQLRCTAGVLWITHDGDPKDIVITAGQTALLREGRRVLVQALESSAYVVDTASCDSCAQITRQ